MRSWLGFGPTGLFVALETVACHAVLFQRCSVSNSSDSRFGFLQPSRRGWTGRKCACGRMRWSCPVRRIIQSLSHCLLSEIADSVGATRFWLCGVASPAMKHAFSESACLLSHLVTHGGVASDPLCFSLCDAQTRTCCTRCGRSRPRTLPPTPPGTRSVRSRVLLLSASSLPYPHSSLRTALPRVARLTLC